jgi:hypothetical protein
MFYVQAKKGFLMPTKEVEETRKLMEETRKDFVSNMDDRTTKAWDKLSKKEQNEFVYTAAMRLAYNRFRNIAKNAK